MECLKNIKSFLAIKRLICILLCSVLIVCSPASKYFDSQRMEKVEAIAVVDDVVIGGLLLGAAAVTLGVVVNQDAIQANVESFAEYLSANRPDTRLWWDNSLQTAALGAGAISITSDFVSSVKEYLEYDGINLQSGHVQSVTYGGGVLVYDVGDYTYPYLSYEYVKNYCARIASSYEHYFISFRYSSGNSCFIDAYCTNEALPINAFVNIADNLEYGKAVSVRFHYSPDRYSNLVTFGVPHQDYKCVDSTGFSNPSAFGQPVNSFSISSSQLIYTNMPVVIANPNLPRACIHDLLANAYHKYGFNVVDVGTSYGGYSDSIVDTFSGMTLTPADLQTIQQYINLAVEGNTVTKDDIEDAIVSAFTVIEGGGNGGNEDEENPGEGEKPNLNVLPSWWFEHFMTPLNNLFEDLKTAVVNELVIINDNIVTLKELLNDVFDDVVTGISTSIQSIHNTALALKNAVENWYGDFPLTLSNLFEGVKLGIRTFFAPLMDWIQDFPGALHDLFDDVLEGLVSLGNLILGLPDAIGNLLTQLWEWLLRILNAILGLPQGIIDLLFVPDMEPIQAHIDDIRDKFGFADSVIALINDIKLRLTSSGPPVIYIDFTQSESQRFNYGGKVKAVDFSWFERYKPYTDSIISAVLWLFFIWRIFRRLPSIIEGASMLNDSIPYHDEE